MKDEKLKTCESQNSSKGKSTFDSSKFSDRIKSSKNSIRSKDTPLNKKEKKIVILKKAKVEKNNQKEMIKSPKSSITDIKKINNKKLSKTELRKKISNKSPDKEKQTENSGKTPLRQIKKNQKINRDLIIINSTKIIKEKKDFLPKIKNKNKKNNNNITVYKESFLTLQNSNENIKKNNLQKNNKQKNVDKTDYSSEDLDNISLDITPNLITDKMLKKDNDKNNKSIERKNKNNIRNKLITLSKNNNIKKNFFSDLNTRMNQTFKNKTLNTSCSNNKNKKNNASPTQSFNISIDKNRTKNKRKSNYLKTEFNNDNKIKENEINNFPKKELNNFNYLKYTVSALNKIVKKKINIDRTNNNSITSRPNITKRNKSITRKETKNKIKSIYILSNTISRYKLYKKSNFFLEDNKPLKEKAKSPKLSKKFSSIYNSTKDCFNKIDNYKILRTLGKGSYGEVKLAIDKLTGIKYAIKMYPKKIMEDSKKKRNIENEIKILKQLDNINIMKLYEVIKTDKFKYLIMEYIEGISLLDIMKKERRHYLEEKRALKIFLQVAKAIEYCQNKNICHRDIKLENILTLKNDIIKLIDFGFAVKTNKETFQTLLCGSPSYMAPEIVKREKYIAQYSDIWSLGVLLYSMLYGRFPFKGKTQSELFENIKKCEVVFPKEIRVDNEIKILLKKIFVDKPEQRPSLKEIINKISSILN